MRAPHWFGNVDTSPVGETWVEIERDSSHVTWRCRSCKKLGISGIDNRPPSTCSCQPVKK